MSTWYFGVPVTFDSDASGMRGEVAIDLVPKSWFDALAGADATAFRRERAFVPAAQLVMNAPAAEDEDGVPSVLLAGKRVILERWWAFLLADEPPPAGQPLQEAQFLEQQPDLQWRPIDRRWLAEVGEVEDAVARRLDQLLATGDDEAT